MASFVPGQGRRRRNPAADGEKSAKLPQTCGQHDASESVGLPSEAELCPPEDSWSRGSPGTQRLHMEGWEERGRAKRNSKACGSFSECKAWAAKDQRRGGKTKGTEHLAMAGERLGQGQELRHTLQDTQGLPQAQAAASWHWGREAKGENHLRHRELGWEGSQQRELSDPKRWWLVSKVW